jgi:hypothetical protein
MAPSVKTGDHKGYYALLGVPTTASAETIKKAYRRRAKELHPDANPAADAVARFQKLNDAYETLRDPEKRQFYDQGASAPQPAATPQPPPRTAYTPPMPTRPQPLHCACGRISAQPRRISFPVVISWGKKTLIKPQNMIYCPSCAPKAALRATLVTWICGWWSLQGPKRTVRALWCNLKGGKRDLDQNLDVLLHQSDAFFYNGKKPLALACLWQAIALSKGSPRHTECLNRLHSRLKPGDTGRQWRLKNKWRPFHWCWVVQALLPVGLLFGAALWLVPSTYLWPAEALPRIFSSPTNEDTGLRENEQLYAVTLDFATVYNSPKRFNKAIAKLRRSTIVYAIPQDNGWMLIRADGGISGYMRTHGLAPADTSDTTPIQTPATDRTLNETLNQINNLPNVPPSVLNPTTSFSNRPADKPSPSPTKAQ